MSDENPVGNPPAETPKSDPPTPAQADPAPAPETPPASAPNKQVSDEPWREPIETLTKVVGDLTQTLQAVTGASENDPTPEPDQHPVKKPWTSWGGSRRG